MAWSRRRKLTNGRRLINDLMRIAGKLPMAGVICDLDVRQVAELRKRIRPKIAWNVLLMKAYARVALRRPELRQIYVGFPWPHLYQHDRNVCMLTISREHDGEQRLLFARFNSPESVPLVELNQQYEHFRSAPIESIRQFRHQIRFANCPALLRRFSWWVMRHLWVAKAASHMGTFGMSISGFNDCFGTRHLSPNTTTLGVDVISRGGISRALLTFDHRVLDGKPAVDIMGELGRELRGPIAEELQELIGSESKAALHRAA